MKRRKSSSIAWKQCNLKDWNSLRLRRPPTSLQILLIFDRKPNGYLWLKAKQYFKPICSSFSQVFWVSELKSPSAKTRATKFTHISSCLAYQTHEKKSISPPFDINEIHYALSSAFLTNNFLCLIISFVPIKTFNSWFHLLP